MPDRLLDYDRYDRLQKLTHYIVQDDLSMDIIESFVYSLNWNEKTLKIGFKAAKEMGDISGVKINNQR